MNSGRQFPAAELISVTTFVLIDDHTKDFEPEDVWLLCSFTISFCMLKL